MWARTQLLLVTLSVGALLIEDVSGERKLKHQDDDVIVNEVSYEGAEVNYEYDPTEERDPLQFDPCMNKHCGPGRICQADDEGDARCMCIEVCETELDPRRKVCTNFNETWPSDCEVYQAQCFCSNGDPRCNAKEYKNVNIEYYGQCREMQECTKNDMADFPRRMRDWLFNIMHDLAERQELSEQYLRMQEAARSNLTLRWANAAVWKWCDLDGSPHDRTVSKHELFPIRAPLMALEHCIAPFLDSCDINDDYQITLKEWGKCLELDEDTLDDKCGALAEIAADQE